MSIKIRDSKPKIVDSYISLKEEGNSVVVYATREGLTQSILKINEDGFVRIVHSFVGIKQNGEIIAFSKNGES